MSEKQKVSAAIGENPLAGLKSSIQWIETLELGYTEPDTLPLVCFRCGKSSEDSKLSKCAKCQTGAYCSRDCQVADWKTGGHKLACPSYKRLTHELDNGIKEEIRAEIFGRIRFYVCPYAIHKWAELGKGFVFVQSDTTLEDLSIPIPKDRTGRRMTTRFVLIHYLTHAEYSTEVMRDDFEMGVVGPKLLQLIEAYDPEKEIVLLYRLRCGHVALGTAALVPDIQICRQLAREYYADSQAGALQLNLDDL